MSGCPVRVKVRGVELAMRASEAKPHLAAGPLFLWGHGLLGSIAQEDAVPIFDWSSVCACAQLVRYDARSHGDSDLDLDPAHPRWPELARDMIGLADVLGARRALLPCAHHVKVACSGHFMNGCHQLCFESAMASAVLHALEASAARVKRVRFVAAPCLAGDSPSAEAAVVEATFV
jgi:pimeloyl-ACP methyl ester carboxylesterase